MITTKEAYDIFKEIELGNFQYNGIEETDKEYIFETHNFKYDTLFGNLGNPIVCIDKENGNVRIINFLDDPTYIRSAKKIEDPIFF